MKMKTKKNQTMKENKKFNQKMKVNKKIIKTNKWKMKKKKKMDLIINKSYHLKKV